MPAEPPIAQCTLEASGVSAQRERYRRLACTVIKFDRRPRGLVVHFAPDVDRALVEETLAIERRS